MSNSSIDSQEETTVEIAEDNRKTFSLHGEMNLLAIGAVYCEHSFCCCRNCSCDTRRAVVCTVGGLYAHTNLVLSRAESERIGFVALNCFEQTHPSFNRTVGRLLISEFVVDPDQYLSRWKTMFNSNVKSGRFLRCWRDARSANCLGSAGSIRWIVLRCRARCKPRARPGLGLRPEGCTVIDSSRRRHM